MKMKKKKLSKRARVKELTGINLASIKKEIKLMWGHIHHLRASHNQSTKILAERISKLEDWQKEMTIPRITKTYIWEPAKKRGKGK